MNLRYWSFVGTLSLVFLGAGCGSPTPQPPVSTFDVSRTQCSEIADARQKVLAAYSEAVRTAEQTWSEAREVFQSDLNNCLQDIWKGGPCDKEAKEADVAAKNAWADIANDDAYHGWKKAKANWDACYANREAKYKEWSEKGLERERQCRDEFNAKNGAAQQAYTDAVKAAKIKRDADLAFLDELEKKCKEKEKTQTGGGVSVGGTSGGTTGGTTPPSTTPKPKPWVQTPPTLPASACQSTVPGSQTSPRQGRAKDFGPKDVAANLLVQVAEEVTKTPVPLSAIDHQIFAGMVCVKIRTRIAQMVIEASDFETSGRTALAQRINRKIEQYGQALSTWCAIAEGRATLPEVKKEAAAIGTVRAGVCTMDSECGAPLCCSANSIATARCVEGQCVSMVNNCSQRDICMGPDSTQPLYDHCGPAHEGNWGYGKPRPSGSVSNRPAPGVRH